MKNAVTVQSERSGMHESPDIEQQEEVESGLDERITRLQREATYAVEVALLAHRNLSSAQATQAAQLRVDNARLKRALSAAQDKIRSLEEMLFESKEPREPATPIYELLTEEEFPGCNLPLKLCGPEDKCAKCGRLAREHREWHLTNRKGSHG